MNTLYCTSELLFTVFTHHLLTSHIKYVEMLPLVCAAHFITIIYGAITSFRSGATAANMYRICFESQNTQ